MTTGAEIWIGFDRRPVETVGFAVARHSILRTLDRPIPVYGLHLDALTELGLYQRRTEMRDGRLWDVISGAPMSTEFAISRFLVPYVSDCRWALFTDADVLARESLTELFAQADPSKACMVVKHANYQPASDVKKDGQAQIPYARKNWSSVVLWNCAHPGAQYLTPHIVNAEKGLWLHQFTWLDDSAIGELDPGWNHLVGEAQQRPNAKLVHFTQGTPNIPGYEDCEFAQEWRNELKTWARNELRLAS